MISKFPFSRSCCTSHFFPHNFCHLSNVFIFSRDRLRLLSTQMRINKKSITVRMNFRTFRTFAGVPPLPTFGICQNIDDQGGKFMGAKPRQLLTTLRKEFIHLKTTHMNIKKKTHTKKNWCKTCLVSGGGIFGVDWQERDHRGVCYQCAVVLSGQTHWKTTCKLKSTSYGKYTS